jgi:outer membrane protein OmpA-like peptidoglycan-associated protein
VREIAGKTTGPIKTSDKGFEESPFVGTIIANNPLEVSDRDVPKKFSKATFDTAAGQTVKGTGGQWVSKFMPVPDSLTAQFQLRGSKVPDELEGTSVAEFKEQAHMLLLWLAENSDLTITIHAHTDASGTPKYNVDLSKKRAASAENYLADKKIWTGINGIPPALAPERVTAIGDGQTRHEEYLKKTNPTNWMKIIGTPDAANTLFRIFEIKYNLTG